eukprot:6509765-Pyramimonas_sp.AAC.1
MLDTFGHSVLNGAGHTVYAFAVHIDVRPAVLHNVTPAVLHNVTPPVTLRRPHRRTPPQCCIMSHRLSHCAVPIDVRPRSGT